MIHYVNRHVGQNKLVRTKIPEVQHFSQVHELHDSVLHEPISLGNEKLQVY